jgi:hypothetical protein
MGEMGEMTGAPALQPDDPDDLYADRETPRQRAAELWEAIAGR